MRNVKRRQTLITAFQTIFKLLATTYNCFIETIEQALALHLKVFFSYCPHIPRGFLYAGKLIKRAVYCLTKQLTSQKMLCLFICFSIKICIINLCHYSTCFSFEKVLLVATIWEQCLQCPLVTSTPHNVTS